MMRTVDGNVPHGSTTTTLDGTEYVAVGLGHFDGVSLDCDDCAFKTLGPLADSDCKENDCGHVVWMTPTKYITLRLTT